VCLQDKFSASLLVEIANGKVAATSLGLGRGLESSGPQGGLQQLGVRVLGWGYWR